MADAHDHAFMARALTLARQGLYTTKPNPAVGCVLVREGRIVGEGYTAPAGGPHAERRALAAAGGAAAGATAYVSLEPCSHFGRTGPCAAALIEAGVARVVCPGPDPNPLVTGGGIAALRQAGIEVEMGVLARTAEEINRGFFARMRRGRPWVRVKIAASLDGRTALANGRSQWITGESARRDVHRWRARAGAVLTGIGTVLADDPGLDARLDADIVQPRRVILDSRLRTPPAARTLTLPGEVIVFSGVAGGPAHAALGAAGARLEHVQANPRCDLAAVLERLAALECNDVLVEAGPALSGAFLEAGLIDELVLYLAPHLLGSQARPLVETLPLTRLADRHSLVLEDVRRLGDDLRVIARPATVAAPPTR